MSRHVIGAAALALAIATTGPAAADSRIPEFTGCQPGRMALLASFFDDLNNPIDRARAEQLMAIARQQQASGQVHQCIQTLDNVAGVLRYAMVLAY